MTTSIDTNQYPQGIVPISTIVPQNEDLFIPYFTRLYENMASAINIKDGTFFTIPISSTATNIPNVANFGSFVISVSAAEQAKDQSWPPSAVWIVCKSSSSIAGTGTTPITFQAGQGAALTTWVGATLTLSSTATNFQIQHSVSGVIGNFNIRIVGTQ